MTSPDSFSSPNLRRKRQKCELPSPLPFRLYRIRGKDSKESDRYETDIREWFDGEVEFAFISNFMIDLEWLISAVPSIATIPDVVIVHGENNDQHLHETMHRHNLTQITLHKPPLPIPYGTHHSKACILKYPRGVRVVIHTSNLIYGDCGSKTQGAWIQDFPPKIDHSATSDFECDLLAYLKKLKIPRIQSQKLVEILKMHDFSGARGRLVASVPGYHVGEELNQFGHLKVRQILEKENFENQFKRAPIACQFSSLGSIDEKWLFKEFIFSLSQGKFHDDEEDEMKLETPGKTDVQLIWPTVCQVRDSTEGWAAGRSIPGIAKNIQKPFLQSLWHKYDGRGIDREREMPHIKTYTRYQESDICWVMLTSHNLSKAAWGTLQKKETQFMIRSYELGILFLPSLEEQYWKSHHCQFSCLSLSSMNFLQPQRLVFAPFLLKRTESRNEEEAITDEIACPLPFRVPPAPYSPEDKPWMTDVPFEGVDSLGNVWGSPWRFYGIKEET